MVKKFLLFFLVLVLGGCGADSDLLRDNSNNSPSGLAYESLKNNIYKLERVNEDQVGFEYVTLSEECDNGECNRLIDNYLLFNGESKKIPAQSAFVLSQSGWFEKSTYSECSLTFKKEKVTERCPDGLETLIHIQKHNLQDSSIVNELTTTGIRTDMLKDPEGKFTYNAWSYTVTQKSTSPYYSILNSDASKCSTTVSQETFIESSNLSEHESITCSIDNQLFTINNAMATEGSFSLDHNLNSYTWYKRVLFDEYEVIELNTTKAQYFIAPYQNSIRMGHIVDQEISATYLNTEAFNTIYTQLNDEYKSESETYKKLQDNYYEVDFYGGLEAFKRVHLDDNEAISYEYLGLENSTVTANWILLSDGLKRESLSCDTQLGYHGYSYKCEDGREGAFSFASERTLKNDLMISYLEAQGKHFNLSNFNRFFSPDAQELSFQHKNKSGKSYLFNVDNSHDIGLTPLEDDAVSLSSESLYVSKKDRSAYVKLIGLDQSASGVIEIYELNSSIHDDKEASIASAIKIDLESSWEKVNFGGKNLIEIQVDNTLSRYFNTNQNVLLMEFMLREQKIISGVAYEEEGTTMKRYLNLNAFEDVQNNIE
jgi:hypothetical protein